MIDFLVCIILVILMLLSILLLFGGPGNFSESVVEEYFFVPFLVLFGIPIILIVNFFGKGSYFQSLRKNFKSITRWM